MKDLIVDMLKGKKTYIISAMMAVYALLGAYLGQLDGAEMNRLILEALGLSALRNSIK